MTFTKKHLSIVPIEDNVFKVVKMAKEDIAINGIDNVVDASIGSLYDEQGKLVAYTSVYDNFNQITNQTKAAYAQSFAGNHDYIKCVNQWIIQNADFKLLHNSVATIGGTGAISLAMSTMLEAKQCVLAPNIAWASYKLMAEQFDLDYQTYPLMKEDRFDLEGFQTAVLKILEHHDKIMIILNDPCHNPTGLSMGKACWQEVIAFLNAQDPTKSIIILNDIAYIDYCFNLEHSRDYLEAMNDINPNILFLVSFSISKTLTSYGMRTGALFIAHRSLKTLEQVLVVAEKACRSIWSNIPNGAMHNFSSLMLNHQQAFLDEKQSYIDLLRERSQIFINEALLVGLECYHYDEGFFITLKLDNDIREKLHQSLIEHHIYTVKVNLGIRIAICSLPIDKTKGLATKIKEIMMKL